MLKLMNPGVVVSENGIYKYKGVELTPMVFADILITLFDGKIFRRDEAIATVKTFHQGHGGLLGKKDYVSAFKHCCQRQIPNYLENVGYATWKLNYQESSCEVVIKTELASEESPEPDVAADKELGSGSGAVYVYYFDIYRKLANLENKARWPCKVGMTDRDAISRVISQAGTAYPELPHVALVLKTDTPRELEAALHAALKFKKRHMTAAPGKEWFQTTPEEVESLYEGLTA